MLKVSNFIILFLISIFYSSKSFALTFNDIKAEINEAFYQYEMVANGYMKLGDVEIIYLIVPAILIFLIGLIVIGFFVEVAGLIGTIIGGALVGIFWAAKYLTDYCIDKFSDHNEDYEFREKLLRFIVLIFFLCLITVSIIFVFYAIFLLIF